MRRSIHAVLAAAISLLFYQAAAADLKKIDRYLQAYYDTGKFQGSVLVAEKGEVVLRKGYGMANLELSVPNGPATKFRLGSITKQFTAVLVLQQAARGKVRLDAKITEYLPEYPAGNGNRITVEHLLTHQAGVPNYTTPEFMRKYSRQPYSPVELARTFWEKDLDFDPGTKYAYSNSGYHVLGLLIEQVTGKSWEEALREGILKPAGMADTGYDRSEAILAHRAAGYQATPDGVQNATFVEMSIPYSAGAMYSTVDDLYRWDRALYTEQLLPAKFRDMLFEPRVKIGTAPTGLHYGYGFMIDRWEWPGVKPARVVWHGGGIPGFSTQIVRLPDHGHLIVMLCNKLGVGWGEAARGVAGILYGQNPPLPKRSIAEPLYSTVRSQGIEAAVSQYRELRSKKPDDYDFREPALNQLGYLLLGRKQVRQAIEIFKLNVEAYPKSANVYDSLGAAYRAAGERELAIQNYRRALELNPKSATALKALKELEETQN
jgi:CubicO group peptidase (beta-lactamase class C family)